MLCDCDCDCDCNCGACNAACDTPCDVCQGACLPGGGGQLASQQGMPYNFGMWARDDIILKTMPQALYNEMGAAIDLMANYVGPAGRNGGAQRGANRDNTDSGGWTWDPETRDFIYADKTTELINGANSLGGGTTVAGVPLPLTNDVDIVYANYFNALATAINTMILNVAVCIHCNVSCDANCYNCNVCISCDDSTAGPGGGGCDCDCDCDA